ncbi:MAG: hypothetical protein ACUVTY_00400 [Armatimonadota bacterium]
MQQWLNDPKNKPIVIGGAVAVILIVALALFMFMGGGGQQQTAPSGSTATAPTGGTPGGGLPEDQPTATGPAPAPMMGGPTMGQPMMGGAPSGFGAGQPVAQAPKEGRPPSQYRIDPFKPLPWEADISKPPVLSVVPPVRLQPIPTYKPKKEEEEDILPPQPYRRVAGIMWGQSVAAIIETQGDLPRVVKPGDTLDGMRVARIEPNQVVLSTLGKKPREIAVKLGAPITPVQRTIPGAGVPGYPGMPGMPPMGGGAPGGAGLLEEY